MMLKGQIVFLVGCLIPVSVARISFSSFEAAVSHRVRLYLPFKPSSPTSFLLRPRHTNRQSIRKAGDAYHLACRGGASDEESEDEYDVYDTDGGDEEEQHVQSKPSTSGGSRGNLLNSVISISKAISRALSAALSGSPTEDTKNMSLLNRVLHTLGKMWTAAINPDDSEVNKTKVTTKGESKNVPYEHEPADFGNYLAQAYGVEDRRDTGEGGPTSSAVLGGTLNEALQVARASARLLIVFIPSASPKAKKGADVEAVTALLSSEVSAAAAKKARKTGDTASYLLWSAKAGSSEATLAMKRLKIKATSRKGDKRPILLVAYPAQLITSTGVPKVVPKVLSQHHCSPPPNGKSMAQWMNELRRRHSKQYAKMQLDRREAQLFKERKEGYKESVQSDVERKKREKKQEEERLAKEKAERERLEALKRRRKDLLESLPEEPGTDVKDAFTIAIRFPDGRSGRRRFNPDTELSVVFNWVDAEFEMEREMLILTTMNGKQTFDWDEIGEQTLEEGGFGRMTGFRITEKSKGDEEDENGDNEESKLEN